MKRILALTCALALTSVVFSQTAAYVFARSPQFVSYQLENFKSSFSQGVSTGIGITHEKLFMELGTFVLQGDNYGYYSFFGSNIKSADLGNSVKLNTNLFGEVTRIPTQVEQSTGIWIFTSGVCLFPNIQIQKMNVGIPLCLGVAYQENSLLLNSRFILNLSFSLK